MTAYIRNSVKNGSYYGKAMLFVGLLIAVPMIIPLFYPHEAVYITAFLLPSALSVAFGLVLCILRHVPQNVREYQSPLQRGSLPVLFTWCFAFTVGAVPIILGEGAGFIPAMFDAASGWTTLGVSLFDVETMPRIFIFYRSFMQFCGGIGFILMFAVFARGKQSMTLYVAEGHTDRIMPSLKKTARVIFLIYAGSLTGGTFLYRLFGMPLFEAVCHTMTAISTAGFSTQPGSIGDYGNIPIEILTIVFMLIGSTNFAVLFYIVQQRFRHFPFISELRFLVLLLVLLIPVVAVSLINHLNMSVGQAFLRAAFGIVSVFSTTGYVTMDYVNEWPPLAMGIMIILIFTGGGMGSTAGGLKLLRVYLLLRICAANIKSKVMPPSHVNVSVYHTVQGKENIDDELIKDTTGYVVCHFAVFLLGALLLTVTSGANIFEAMFEFGSVLSTVGLSTGIINADASAATLIVLMLGMILGRLEIFIVFIGIYTGGTAVFRKFFDA